MVFDSLFQKMSQNLPVYLQMYPPPPNEKVGSQVNVIFWLWMMYPPPPRNEKVGSQVNMTFWFWMMYHPPTRNEKVGFQLKVTFLVLDDVTPPPQIIPPPPRNKKKLDLMSTWHIGSGSCTPLLIEINMNAIENNWGQQVLFSNLPFPPPQYNLILCLNRKLVNFNWIWIHGLKPHLPPLSS